MATLAGAVTGPEALPAMLGHLRSTFAMSGAALFRRANGRWAVEVADGTPPPATPGIADVQRDVGPDLVLTLSGRSLDAADQGVLTALADQLAAAVEARRLQGEADRAAELAAANDFRSALLQAVSHDLRTPLAGIKASISSLRGTDVEWSEDDVAQFQRTIEEETDRLDALVASLLDMGRIQAGAVVVERREVALEEVVPAVLAGLGARADAVVVEVSETLPVVLADPVLLERVVANLVDNALKVTPQGGVVRLEAGRVPGGVDLRVVDRGPGIPETDRERVFEPYQRTDDRGTGVGLGLAIARGFLEAMGAELGMDDTPGGGTTMIAHLPCAEDPR
jgi:two-component system sensor histidine kinase KdpD